MTLVPASLAWVAGVAALQWQPGLPPPIAVWACALVAAGCAAGALAAVQPGAAPAVAAPHGSRGARWRRTLAVVLCLVAGAAAGFGWAAFQAASRMSDALSPAWERRDIELVGVVAELTQRTERGMRFAFDVEHVLTDGAVVPARIVLSWYGPRQAGADPGSGADAEAADRQPVQAGERWRLVVRLRRPHGPVNPHGFDVEAWLLERNLRATGYVRRSVALLDARVERPLYLVERARERIRARFERTLGQSKYLGVLAALAIGDQRAIPAAQWETFTRTGINHLMSISGLHVTMIAGLAFWLTDFGWRRSARLAERLPARKAATIAGLAVAFGYALLAGFSVPTRRTVFMLAVIAIALWRARRAGAASILAGALFAVSLLDPWAVLAPGFWLSFGAVALIMGLGAGRLAPDGLDARGRGDASAGRQTGNTVPGPRGRRLAQALQRLLRQWTRVQWAITVGMVPITIALFGQASLVSPIANAFAIPVISALVVPITLVAAVLPVPVLLHLAHAITAACLAPIEYLSSLPWAVWVQPAPPPWASALAMAGVGWWLMPAGWPGRSLGLLALLPVLLARPAPVAPGTLEITMLDVGHGLAIVARTAQHTLVYDAGPAWSSDSDAGARIVLPYLRGEGVRRIDMLVVSHDDIDHSGGAVSLLRSLPVDALVSSLPAGHPAFAYMLQPLRCHAGQQWTWDAVQFRILHPEWDSYAERSVDNERSCVLQVEAAGVRALITGDIGVRSEARLLAAQRRTGSRLLASAVLLVPHHGSGGSSSAAFVSAVAPQHALMSIGYLNRFGHPRPDVVERYRAAGANLLRTDQAGAVRLTIAGDGIVVRREREHARRYWRARPP